MRCVGALLVGMGRRVVMLQVFGVGKCCGRADLFGEFYGAKTEFDLTKT